MKPELKPCPFCGGEAAFNSHKTNNKDLIKLNGRDIGYGVNCVECGTSNLGIILGYKTEEDAANAWNRRAPNRTEGEAMNPTLHAYIKTLRAYQAWRTGEDARTMDEAGVRPSRISAAMNAVLDFAENHLRDGMKKAEPVNVPSDEELLEWAEQEQFFLFCDKDEFLDIARTLLAKYGTQK